MDISPILATPNPIAQVTMVDFYIYLVPLVMLVIFFIKMKEVILEVMLKDVEVCLKRSDTLSFTMTENSLMVMEEVDKSLKTSPLSPIIKIGLLYHCVLIVMVTTEVDIGFSPANFALYNHGVLYIYRPKFHQEAIPRGGQRKNPHRKHTYYSYLSMSPHPHPSMP